MPNIRYSKLEDEILSKVNQILENMARLDEAQYQTTFPQFTEDFLLGKSNAKYSLYGRFITVTNAMISYKLHQMHAPQNNVSEVVAEGIKINKKNKSTKKKRKYQKKDKPKTKGKVKAKPKKKLKVTKNNLVKLFYIFIKLNLCRNFF